MFRKRYLIKIHFFLAVTVMILMAVSLLLSMNEVVKAGIVPPSNKRTNKDVRNIDDEQDETGYVRLQEGETYYLSHFIPLMSNSTIDARGATIIVNKGAVRNDTSNYKTGYNSMSNIKIIGGKWISAHEDGCSGTTFSFAHCQNITLEKMDIRTTNAQGHAIELVACKNVTIKDCKVIAQGKSKKKSVEEMIQIDLAAPHTAPFLKSKYQNGLACKNIKVIGCTITGSRGLCANYAKEDKKYRKKYHDKILVKNCTITGRTSEALALFNAINVEVKNNKIITKSKRTGSPYSIGCHVALFGKISKFSKGKIRIYDNVIKGGRQGFQICSHSKSRYGSLIIKNNKLYSKKGKSRALVIQPNIKRKPSVRKAVRSGNVLYKWK